MFSTRISRPKRHPRLPLIALSTSLALLLTACGGGSDGGGSSSSALSITGSVNTADYTISRRADGWSRLAQWLGFSSAFAEPLDSVDTLVAIPSDHGNVDVGVYGNIKSASLAADGSFELTLTKEYDWVLLLVNSKAPTPDQKVVAYVTIPASVSVAADGSLIDLPFSAATSDAIDIGTLSADPANPQAARSDKDAKSIEASVTLSLDDLKHYAKYDDDYRHLANVYLNYNKRNGEYYFPTVEWRWQGVNNTDLGKDFSRPDDFVLRDSAALIETNTQSLKFSDLCDASVTFGLFPPKTVSINKQSFSATSGIMNQNMSMGSQSNNYCYNDNQHIEGLSGGGSSLSFGFPITSVEGSWRLKANDQTIAQFDFALSDPLDKAGHPLNFVPQIRIQYDGTSADKMASIDIQWLQYDAASSSYVNVADDAVTDQLVSTSFINLVDYSPAAQNQDINFIQYDNNGLISGNIAIGGNYDWYLGSAISSNPSNGVAHVSDISIGYKQGGISYRFSWGERAGRDTGLVQQPG